MSLWRQRRGNDPKNEPEAEAVDDSELWFYGLVPFLVHVLTDAQRLFLVACLLKQMVPATESPYFEAVNASVRAVEEQCFEEYFLGRNIAEGAWLLALLTWRLVPSVTQAVAVEAQGPVGRVS